MTENQNEVNKSAEVELTTSFSSLLDCIKLSDINIKYYLEFVDVHIQDVAARVEETDNPELVKEALAKVLALLN